VCIVSFQCVKHPESSTYVCGQLILKYQRQNFTVFPKKPHELYFVVTLQITTRREYLITLYYIFRTSDALAKSVSSNAVSCPDDMEEPEDHLMDRYFCSPNTTITAKSKNTVQRHDVLLSLRYVLHNEDLSVPRFQEM
jgi:hypothetical protein